ncbi:unnamed protein product [Mytilus edulis]|uniref:Uncharacterized protein n=1 Tax=Mytilus edulis TaxID=6550 RepID=A0A8S3UXY4_MYTED|nr:unnamed protein product [Mytilus edulis]
MGQLKHISIIATLLDSIRRDITEYEHKCYTCRNRKAKVAEQVTALLPESRFKTPLHDFARTTVDYREPLITVQGRENRHMAIPDLSVESINVSKILAANGFILPVVKLRREEAFYECNILNIFNGHQTDPALMPCGSSAEGLAILIGRHHAHLSSSDQDIIIFDNFFDVCEKISDIRTGIFLIQCQISPYDFQIQHILGKSWPIEAIEWTTRKRPSNWPSRELYDNIIKSDYLLAGVGNKESNECEIQWRVSFNTAERLIIESFNETQIQCLILFENVERK